MKHHYYPGNLAPELLARWPAAATSLPPLAELEYLISVAYQASLLQEEGQAVRCWLVLSTLEELPKTATSGFYVLELAASLPYEEQEIRRLAPALRSPGTVLAVRTDADAGLLIWGLLRSPLPWSRDEEALSLPPPRSSPALLLDVCGPGNLVFYHGRDRVLTLQNGHVEGHGFVEYPVAWSKGRFSENIDAIQPYLVAAGIAAPAATLRPKHPMRLPEQAHYYNGLQLAIIARLAELGDINWRRYQRADDARLLELSLREPVRVLLPTGYCWRIHFQG